MGRVLLWLGAAFAAAGAALFAICLTRLFGLLYPANSIFVITGAGAGGVVLGALIAHRLCWLPRRAPAVSAAGGALVAGLAVLVLVVLAGTASSSAALVYVALVGLAYAAAGAALAAPFALRPQDAAVVFVFEAAGGGLATLVASAAIDALGPLSAGLAAALLSALGGLLSFASAMVLRGDVADVEDDVDEGFDLRRAARWTIAGVGALGTVLALAAFPLQLAFGWLAIDPWQVRTPKALFLSMHDDDLRERVVYSAWDSVARVDVTEPANNADVRWAYQDGSVAGLMYRSSAAQARQMLQNDIANLPFQFPGARGKVLIIGAGTGQEVQLALAAGATEVVAAETNGALLRATRGFPDFTGGWTENPAVRLVEQDGRAFLRASNEQFDVIYLTVGTGDTAVPGGPVTGSVLYTIDAFGDYLDHLRQDGRLVLKLRDEQEFTRAFNTAFQSLSRRGAAPLQALRRLLAINNQPLAERGDGGIALPLLIVRKTPFVEDEAKAAYEVLQQTPFTPIYFPFLEQSSPFAGWAVDEYGPEFFEARAPYDIRPVTDSSPFFFEFDKGFPWAAILVPLLIAAAAGVTAWFTRRPSGEGLESAADLPEDVVAFLEDDLPWRFAAFCALAAAGFAAAQSALVNRLPLLVGDPRLVVVVGYGIFLLAAALGSLLTLRVGPDALRPAIGWAGLAAGVISLATMELLPMAAASMRSQSWIARVAVGAAFAAPLGLCFGVLFPSALRMLAHVRRGGWSPFLWSLSAFAGLVAAILALALGIAWSFNAALGFGALCLFAAFMIAGLRLLRAAPLDEPAPAAPPVDHTPFQRPVEPTPAP